MKNIKQLVASFSLVGLLMSGVVLDVSAQSSSARSPVLKETCSISIMNRTVQVAANGSWRMNNVPSFMGRVRARATCLENGETRSGQSEFFSLQSNSFSLVEQIFFDDPAPIPVSLFFSDVNDIALTEGEPTATLSVSAAYSDGTTSPTLRPVDGLNFNSSNSNIVAVDENGRLAAVSSGRALITVRLEGTIGLKSVTVTMGGDMDGDGLPDSYELANGLDPNDAADAFEDTDGDNLNALAEFAAGTDVNNADSDGDGIADGEELIAGADGFFTNPLLADTDGDGFSDGLELDLATDPTDSDSFDLAQGLASIRINPTELELIFNGINTEVSDSIAVVGLLIDGGELDITASRFGTNITSSRLDIVSFGTTPGEVFGGIAGEATLTATNNGYTASITATVSRFDPVALSAIDMPGYANNVDAQGDYAYVAAGDAGLVIVDVSDKSLPVVVGQLDTNGIAIDVKVSANTVYLAAGEAGVQIIDVSDKANPVLVGDFNTAGVSRDIAVDLRYIYSANDSAGLDVINIIDPNLPFITASLGGLGNLRGVAIDGDRLVTVSDSMLHIVDISLPESPVVLSSINVAKIKDVVVNNDYVFLAVDTSGYQVFDITDPTQPTLVGGETGFVPRDLVLSDGFLMMAERLFPNGVPYVNVLDPENPSWQGNVDLSSLGAYKGTGIAADSRFTYLTAEAGALSAEYFGTGTTRLFIGQHRELFDNAGRAPFVNLQSPLVGDVLVEGTNQYIEVDAVDDVAVREVQFLIDGQVVLTDSAAPYQMLYAIPRGVTELTVSASAVDLGGNTNTTNAISFTVQPDSDSDGLSDEQESTIYNTLVSNPDSDGDGLNDGREVVIGTNPNLADTDGDGTNDADEVTNDTDPLNPDVTLPTVQTITPASNSIDIAESTFIDIEFSEPLSPRSVNLSAIDVRETATNIGVLGNFRLLGNNNRISFEPVGLLSEYTEYQVTISGIKDAAGNAIVAPFISIFTTGDTVDTTKPFVEQMTPVNNAAGVAINSVLSLRFNERINATSLSDATTYLTDQATNTRVSTIMTLSEDRKSLMIVTDSIFAIGRSYRLYVSGIKDLFDNQMTARNYYFTTSFDADTQGPILTGSSIVDGYSSVPTNAILELQFDEPISGLALNGLNLYEGSTIVPLQSRVLSDGNRRVRLYIANLLEPDTGYVLRAENTEDNSGNLQLTPVDVNFTTGSGAELRALTTTNTSPYTNQGGVPLNTRITLSFNQRMNPLALGGLRLYDYLDRVYLPIDIELVRPDTVVVTPQSPLLPNRAYTLNDSPNVGSLTGVTLSLNLYFTTGSSDDTTALTVTSWNVPDGYAAMPLNGGLILEFDAALDFVNCPVADSVTISDGSNNIAYSWTVADNQGRQRLTLTPSQPFTANTTYTVTVDGLCDSAGNTLAIAASQSFTTSAITDTTIPTLVSVSPAGNATGVGVNTPVVWTFSEPVGFDGINITSSAYLYIGSTNNKLSGDLSWNTSRTELTFTPSVDYPANTLIGRGFRYSNLFDLSGNRASYSAIYAQPFTTVLGGSDTVAPTVTQVIPQDGSVDIDRSNTVVLNFSEPLNYATLTTENFGLYANGARISTTVSRSYDNRTVVLSTGSVPANSVISVIATDAVKDLSGNALPDFISVYSTAVANETGRPSVSTVYPGSNANSVHLDKNIVLFTSEAMNISTVTAETVRVSQNGVLVTGSLAVSGDAQVITFTPDQPWTTGSTIQVFATSGLQDVNGNPLNNFQSLFRTIADETTSALQVIATSGLNGLPTNARVGLLFNKPLDPLTVDTASVLVYDNIQRVNVTPIITLTNDNRVIELSMPTGWSANTNNANAFHLISVTGVGDNYGNVLSNHNTFFYTANDAVDDNIAPTVESLSPLDGSDNVGINAQVHMRFSEGINPLTFNPGLQQTLFQSASFSSNNTQLSYIPHQPFAASTQIQLDAPAVTDNAGNTLTPYSVTFTTASGVDLTPPVVEQVIPRANETVPVNGVLQVRFNEPLVPDSINASTVKVYDTIDLVNIATTFTQSSDYRTFTIIPDTALAVGRPYILEIDAVRDMAYNATANNTVYQYFTTSFEADTQGPVLVDLSIPDGAVDIPTNALLELQFDEPLSGLELNGLNLVQGGTIVPLQSRTLSDGNRRVRLRLANPLEPDTAYILRAENTVDTSGNIQFTAVDTGFTTGAGAVLTSLVTTNISPYYNQGGVPLNTRITLGYNQRLNPLAIGGLRLYDTVDRIYVPLDIELIRSDTVVLTPKSPLVANRNYYLNDSPDVGSLTGVTRNLSYHPFTTGGSDNTTALAVTSWNVADGYAAMPLNGGLILEFDAALDYVNCPVADSVTISDGSNNIAYSWTVADNQGRQRLTLTPSQPFTANTTYTVTVDGLCDSAGNTLAIAASQSFTTSAVTDTTIPTLVSVSPAGNATGVGVNTPVVWTFSEPVGFNRLDIYNNAYLYIGSTNNKLSGDLSWNTNHTELTFTPSVDYPANTLIGRSFSYQYLYDLSGNRASYNAIYAQPFTTQ